MWISAQVRRHINRLPIGTLFTTRDFLNYGKRSAIDQVLFLMVRAGRIIRVARGVFVKPGTFGARHVSVKEVAEIKARSFARRIIGDAVDEAAEIGLSIHENREPTYAINGRSSSFRFGDVIVHFRGVSAKKIVLGDCKVGHAIRALWHLGSRIVDPMVIRAATSKLGRAERQKLRLLGHSMPAWLADRLIFSMPARVTACLAEYHF